MASGIWVGSNTRVSHNSLYVMTTMMETMFVFIVISCGLVCFTTKVCHELLVLAWSIDVSYSWSVTTRCSFPKVHSCNASYCSGYYLCYSRENTMNDNRILYWIMRFVEMITCFHIIAGIWRHWG
jgi:hypothetical protein